MNLAILMGRLTKDPEIRATRSGETVAGFDLAVPRGTDTTDFFKCSAFGKTAEFLEKYGHKGTKFVVQGSIRTDEYEKDGKKCKVANIVVNRCEFAESKGAAQPEPKPEPKKNDEWVDVPQGIEEELPFN